MNSETNDSLSERTAPRRSGWNGGSFARDGSFPRGGSLGGRTVLSRESEFNVMSPVVERAGTSLRSTRRAGAAVTVGRAADSSGTGEAGKTSAVNSVTR